ncbi:copper amine oxidase domain protein [Desulfocucumis palustris]|uniref:Copper amine oxidase domain protein n=1 Tax=Desulfocucumis palustris TaxID=1898651 RepID=A0A2L2XEG0_9FIRM|nr:hypothetical protein [Desulfocucumis palustris]GBF34394.1 copper amine oxidase domain protein [Desulfocucumis palustris]
MKKKLIAVILCMTWCLLTLSPAFAETTLSTKQILIDQLKNNELYTYNNEQYQKSKGTLTLQIETLDGSLLAMDDMLPKFKDSSLALDYKLNAPEKKIAADYKVKFDNENYNGAGYLDGNTYIISATTPIIKELLLKEVPNKDISYIYGSQAGLEEFWEQFAKQMTNQQIAVKQFNSLMEFLLEAVPDKYITLSLSQQKILLDVDSNGFYDLLFAISEKVKNERERFADIIAETAVAVDPSVDPGEIKKQILAGIESSIAGGNYPDSPEYIKQKLDGFKLEKLHCEFPLLPGGLSKIYAAFNIADESGANGKMVLDINFSGSKSNLTGNYTAGFTMQNKSDNTNIGVNIAGQFKNRTDDSDSNARFTVNYKKENATLINLSLIMTSNAQADPTVRITVPRLTPYNSINFDSLKEPESKLPESKL